MKIAKFEAKQNSLSTDLRLLIKVAAATQNGCIFCQDIALAHAVKGKIRTEKLQKHFNETEIVQILALNAFEQFYNAMTVPLEIESDGLEKLAENF